MELYTQILDNGGPAFSEILRHVRDRPDEGCLFHCTGELLTHKIHLITNLFHTTTSRKR